MTEAQGYAAVTGPLTPVVGVRPPSTPTVSRHVHSRRVATVLAERGHPPRCTEAWPLYGGKQPGSRTDLGRGAPEVKSRKDMARLFEVSETYLR
jgi:hypothetical protein